MTSAWARERARGRKWGAVSGGEGSRRRGDGALIPSGRRRRGWSDGDELLFGRGREQEKTTGGEMGWAFLGQRPAGSRPNEGRVALFLFSCFSFYLMFIFFEPLKSFI